MISERIAVQFAGISMKTPVMGASGTFGFGVEYSDFLDLDHVGAIISKGITPLPRPGNPGVRVAETPAGMLNCIGLENPGVEVFKRDILPKVHQACQTPLIVNISAGTAEEYGELAAQLDVDGVAALEVNISCPNVKEGGIVFGTQPEAAAAVTRSVKDHTRKPVIVKLSPNVTDITVMAKAVEAAGADAVSLINTLTGMAIDIKTRRPLLGNITGGLSGPAVKPVALRMVWQYPSPSSAWAAYRPGRMPSNSCWPVPVPSPSAPITSSTPEPSKPSPKAWTSIAEKKASNIYRIL